MDYYKKVGDLGSGAFGDVWLARQRMCAGTQQEHLGRLVAVKRVRKPNSSAGLDEEEADCQEALDEMHLEVELLKKMDHPSICKLFEVHEDAKNLYIVMEHIQGRELFEHIIELGHFSEGHAAGVVQQLAAALTYCHKRGVVHRDVKPENVMVLDQEVSTGGKVQLDETPMVKLIDFGFGCRILDGAKLKAKVGSKVYMAPEVLRGEPCDEKQDMWSLGCVLYILLSGLPPFSGGRKTICRQIDCGKYLQMNSAEWSEVSANARGLIAAMLTPSLEQRLTAADVLRHPWMSRRIHHSTETSLQQIDALKRFHKQSMFRQVCAGVMARQLGEHDLHELHTSFCEMDENEDGIISLDEFKKGFKALGPELEAIFASVDMDGSGCLDYTEFIAACIDRRIESQESVCWSAFQVFDKDGNGKLEFEELREVMNHASVQEAFPTADTTLIYEELAGRLTVGDTPRGERSIDFDHFLAALRRSWSTNPNSWGDDAEVPLCCKMKESQDESAALPLCFVDGSESQYESAALLQAPTEPVGKTRPGLSMGLPIARRASPQTSGLPIPVENTGDASRSTTDTLTAPGLPIAARSKEDTLTVPGLPIIARTSAVAPNTLGLPIATRSAAKGLKVPGLPIAPRNKSAAVAMGLPVCHDAPIPPAPSLGLPIKNRHCAG